jgi:hypothetical protein
LERLREMQVPIPADVRPCLEARVARDPAALADVAATDVGQSAPSSVMDLAAACMREQRALPAFVRGLEAQLGHALGPEQRACIDSAYLVLDPEVLAAAEADALGASDDAQQVVQLRNMVAKCGVELDAP